MGIISTAYAASTPSSAQNGASSLIMLAVFFAVFYFLLWRPQAKRAKEQRALLAGLARGDEVVTTGGLVGRIMEVKESFVSLAVAEGVTLTIQKGAVASVLPKGTMKLTD